MKITDLSILCKWENSTVYQILICPTFNMLNEKLKRVTLNCSALFLVSFFCNIHSRHNLQATHCKNTSLLPLLLHLLTHVFYRFLLPVAVPSTTWVSHSEVMDKYFLQVHLNKLECRGKVHLFQ